MAKITKRLAAAHEKVAAACQEAFEAANASDHGSAPSYGALGAMADCIGKTQASGGFDGYNADGDTTDDDAADATQEAAGGSADDGNRAFDKALSEALAAHVRESGGGQSGGRSAATSGRRAVAGGGKMRLRVFSGR